MKADKININALKFGIMCNFTPFCGEERARESVELIMELERLAEIGRATEFAMQDGSKHTVFAKGIDYLLEFYYRESEEE